MKNIRSYCYAEVRGRRIVGAMETYIIELFDGKKRVDKEQIRTDDYDDVLKRVAEIIAKTEHRIEIWDSKAYRHRNKDVCR